MHRVCRLQNFFSSCYQLFAALIPEHTFIGFNWKSQQNVKNLILGGRNSEPYEGAVLIRERLWEALGVEDSIEEHIKRSIFCWWLHTYFDEIVSGAPIEGQVIADPNPTAIEDNQKRILWPFMKQGKGLRSANPNLNLSVPTRDFYCKFKEGCVPKA